MLFEELLKDETRKTTLLNAVEVLKQQGILPALLDNLRIRSAIVASTTPMEHAALQAAWGDGYAEALMDLFDFKARYFADTKPTQKAPNFGALDKLFAQGTITLEEKNELARNR